MSALTSPRRQIVTHLVLHDRSQFDQAAVEEMPGLGQAHERWRRVVDRHVGVHRGWIDDFVGLALNHEPGAVGRAQCGEIAQGHRRRDHDQLLDRQLLGGAQRDIATERKSGEPERIARAHARKPGRDRERIVGLAIAMVVGPGRCADAAEIKT
ncbi:MAG: hypothetical protein E6K53_13970 [Gammaproteobacteria bacterium]|nr:MAG: hypothetical protein E6K53_13970 [Gammaproteobacteria bacterium]